MPQDNARIIRFLDCAEREAQAIKDSTQSPNRDHAINILACIILVRDEVKDNQS